MATAFFRALAASASVFIAILTALLVNEYTRIHGERTRISHRLERIEGEKARYQTEREEYERDKQRIDADWEAEYREEAEDRVDEFIEDYIGSDFCEPIETSQIQDLLDRLANYHDFESVTELYEEVEHDRSHHRNILEERRVEIEDIDVEDYWVMVERKRERATAFLENPSRKTFADLVDKKHFWATRARGSIDH